MDVDWTNNKYLKVVRIKYNKLKEIPLCLTKLASLTVLELCGNQIEKFDTEIKDFSKLQELDLSGNLIKTLPDDIYHLKHLKVIYFIF